MPEDAALKIDPDLYQEAEKELDMSEERAWLDENFPGTRADCENGSRPCICFRCKFNLALDVNPKTGTIKVHFDPTDEREKGRPTCALDVADEGGKTLEEIGGIIGRTRERARQIEDQALKHLRVKHPELFDLWKEIEE